MTTLLDNEFHELAQILLELSGITVPENKKYLFSSRLSKRLQTLQLPSYGAYSQFVRQHKSTEGEIFINCMTTNLSYFFREPHHFKSLTTAFGNSKTSLFKVGSFGCSTGEEPISIAISLLEAGAKRSSFQIFASDIDTEVLTFAKKGVYGSDKIGQVEAKILSKYFTKSGTNYLVNSEIMSAITYKQANLTANQIGFAENSLDIVFCRNALIYFSPEAQKTTATNLSKLLKRGGVLCLGHAELLTDIASDLTFIGQSTYSKKQ